MGYFRIEGEDDNPPKFVVEPKEMDQILRREWGNIFRGNHDDNAKLTADFCTKYSQYIFAHEEVEAPAITQQQVWEAF